MLPSALTRIGDAALAALTTIDMDTPNLGWVAAGCYMAAIVSAILPWVNAEVLMLAAAPLAGSPFELGTLVALVTAGQMTGKSFAYWMARTATQPRVAGLQKTIDQWRDRLARRPRSALGVLLVSATVGLPPFYVVAPAAGALKVAFARFLVVGTIGRFVHFGLVVLAPQLVGRIS